MLPETIALCLFDQDKIEEKRGERREEERGRRETEREGKREREECKFGDLVDYFEQIIVIEDWDLDLIRWKTLWDQLLETLINNKLTFNIQSGCLLIVDCCLFDCCSRFLLESRLDSRLETKIKKFGAKRHRETLPGITTCYI